MLYRYFKQLFAQVTNPAMDSINERPVMALYSTLGAEKNLLEETARARAHVALQSPDHHRTRSSPAIRADRRAGLRSRTLPCLFKVGSTAETGPGAALDELARRPSSAVDDGVNILILSDRGVSPTSLRSRCCWRRARCTTTWSARRCAPAAASSARPARRARSAHMALLIGYGAGSHQSVPRLRDDRRARQEGTFVPGGLSTRAGDRQLHQGHRQGLLKTFAKMGISTLQSYRGAQIFEAVGLDREVVDAASPAPRLARLRQWATT